MEKEAVKAKNLLEKGFIQKVPPAKNLLEKGLTKTSNDKTRSEKEFREKSEISHKSPPEKEFVEKTLPQKGFSEKVHEKKPSVKTLVFGKWATDEIKVSDISVAKYLSFESKFIPHTFGKMTRKKFGKGKLSIIERLINKIMRSGQGKRKLSGKYIRGRGSCGKKLQAMKIVEDAFMIISEQTKENPVQALVKAIENSAPREDTTRIKRGGVSYSVSVDVSPLKRIDEALKNIALAAFASSFNRKVKASEALAKEIILASKNDSASFSIKRKDEIERIAISSR